MNVPSVKNFNLRWHQHDQYRISLYPRSGTFSAKAFGILQKIGFIKISDQCMMVETPRDWKDKWDKIYTELAAANELTEIEVSVHPGTEHPEQAQADRKSPAVIQMLGESLWLGHALLDNRIMCYLQPVIGNSRDKVFGYESFARVKALDGTIIAGDKIIAASKVLGIEYMIDRHLHVQAIKTFVSSEFNGFLFVNFFPGFIHRPAVYLEGLSETAKSFGVIAKHIVLDLTKAETPRDIAHLKSICDYGRSRGYSIALDDMESVETVEKLVHEIRPDFVKIDMKLVRQVADPAKKEAIRRIVDMTHAAAGSVIAEGVETEEIHQALRALGVDLFQGYLFSPPVPVEAALKRATS